jgi:hypothetical protein
LDVAIVFRLPDCVEEEHLDTRLIGRVDPAIRRGRPSLRTRKCCPDRIEVVEMQCPDQMDIGGAGHDFYRAVADLVLAKTRKPHRQGDVRPEVVLRERIRVSRLFVDHDHSSHRCSPFLPDVNG